MAANAFFVGPLDRVLFLRTIPIFEGLRPPHLAAIAQHARERVWPAGALMQTPDQAAETVYLVVEGEVELSHADGVTQRIGPGQTVGVLELLSRMQTALTARTTRETVALEFDWDAQFDICEQHFAVLAQYIRYLAGRTIDGPARAAEAEVNAAATELAPPPADRPLNLVERVLVLYDSQEFSHRSPDALAELAHHIAEVRYGAGEVLWDAGAHADHFVLLAAGTVECRRPDGRSSRVRAGTTIGLYEMLARAPRGTLARATGEVVGLRIDFDPFLDILEDHFDLALDVLSLLARNLLEQQRSRGALGP
jgi:CRP-like cAMP-binding protein